MCFLVEGPRYTGAVSSGLLMTCRASERGHASVRFTSDHVEEMDMTVVALLRIIVCGMTVDAARACAYRIDLLPGCQSVTATGALQHDREQKDCNFLQTLSLHIVGDQPGLNAAAWRRANSAAEIGARPTNC